MGYEEKYKSALARANKFYNNEECRVGMTPVELEVIFPELKDSEDEKVKRCISDAVRKYGVEFATGTITKEKMLTWLEKQSEQKFIWHNESEEPERDKLILLIMQSGTPIVAKVIEPNHTFNHGEIWAYIDDLIEKQGAKEVDPRRENLEKLLAADNIYQMSMNEAMVEEAKSKAMNALSELGIGKLLGLERQGERKVIWSEEDEKMFDMTEVNLRELRDRFGEKYGRVGDCIDWLISLKDRFGCEENFTTTK